MANGQAQQRLGAVVEALVERGIEQFESVSVIRVDQLSGDGYVAGDPLAKGNADLLMVKAGGGDGPELLALLIGQEDGAALSFDFSTGDFEDQFQKLSQIKRGVQQARGFKEQRELIDAFVFFLRGQNVVELGCAHFRIKPPPQQQIFRRFTRGVDSEHAGELSGSKQWVAGDVGKAGGTGELKIVTAKGGEHDIFNGGLVVGDLAHGARAGCSVVEPVRSLHAFRVSEITGAGGAVPEPELGASGL